MKNKTLIINADDFGFSKGVNLGIIEGLTSGSISTASLLTNQLGSDDALSWSLRTNIKRIGLHLNLTDGRPIGTKYKTITNKDGFFHSFPYLFFLSKIGKIDRNEAYEECLLQTDWAVKKGLFIHHINDHKWWRLIPSLTSVFYEATEKYPEVRIRYLGGFLRNELFLSFQSINNFFHRSTFVTSVILFQSQIIKFQQRNFLINKLLLSNYFAGFNLSGRNNMKELLFKLINNIPYGITELMIHPGFNDTTLKSVTQYNVMREKELRLICSEEFKNHLSVNNITVMFGAEHAI